MGVPALSEGDICGETHSQKLQLPIYNSQGGSTDQQLCVITV